MRASLSWRREIVLIALKSLFISHFYLLSLLFSFILPIFYALSHLRLILSLTFPSNHNSFFCFLSILTFISLSLPIYRSSFHISHLFLTLSYSFIYLNASANVFLILSLSPYAQLTYDFFKYISFHSIKEGKKGFKSYLGRSI